MRILYVENHPVFARLIAGRLLSMHDVTIVPSLALAGEELENNRFDVILIDYDLDDGKGAELVSDLQNQPQRPKIIAVSAHETGNTAMQTAGADAVCAKADIQTIDFVIKSLFER